MRTLLVPFNQDGLPASVLQTAYVFGSHFQAYMEGMPFDFIPPEYVAVDLFGGGWVPPSETQMRESAAASRRHFEDFMRGKGVEPADESRLGLSYGWHDPEPDHPSVASRSRTFDLTVFARPSPPSAPSLRVMLETTLFEGGRAILVAPPSIPSAIANRILIAWNCSTETARTVGLAMPILPLAEEVIVLTVIGGTVPGPSGSELCRHLRYNNVKARELTVRPGSQSTGEAILDEATKAGCDLILKGAYTQSRLRQMIFGGATSHILTATEIPVLMAH